MATYDRKTKVHPRIIIMQMLITRPLPYVLIFIFSSAEIFSYKVKLEFIFNLYFFENWRSVELHKCDKEW